MESPLSSSLSFYDLHDHAGAAIPGPVEGRNCGIAIDVPKALRPYISLKVGSESLPLWESETSAYSEWPSCGPGHYQLFLECENIREHRTVTVMPRYFAKSNIASMIGDLTEALPNTIASQLNECGAILALRARDHKSSIEDEYLRLRRAIEGTKEKLGMLQILPMLQRNCHQVLLPQLELRSVDKVRRPDISKMPQAMSIPGNVVSSDYLYQMFDTTVERSFEAYENRLVKAYALALRSRLSMLQAKLEAAMAPPVMATELEALANEFHLAYMRATFLREVRNPSVSSVRVTMVLLKNPAYRAVLEGYLALTKQSSSVTLEEPALNIPLNKFPYLYQRWANLKVLSAMLQVCAESGYRCVSHHWVKSYHKSTSIQVMNDGRPAVQLSCATSGRLVSFFPWSASGGTAYTPGQESSMGAAIVIESPGKPIAILLFDPKYWVDSKNAKMKVEKTSAETNAEENVLQMLSVIEPLQVDVDGIFGFIDQLRVSDGTSEIRYGAILYPGQRKQLAPDIEALPAHPNDGDGLQNIICDLLRRYLV